MNLKTIFLLLTVLLLHSCTECDDNVLAGEFKLSDTSLGFVPYSGSETLTFVDNEGTEHTLNSEKGRVLEPTRMIVRELCDAGFLDKSEMFFNIEREQIAYFDEAGNQVFYTDLLTAFEDDENLDSIAIYDQLYLTANVDSSYIGEIRIITDVRQNEVSDIHKENFRFNETRLIGDTTLYEQNFTEVFVNITNEGKGIYYSKEKGIVAFKLSEEKFWVLKNE